MKLVFVFLTISIFFLFTSIFIVNNFSPFDMQKVEELVSDSKISENSPEQLDQEIQSLVSQGLIFDYLSNNAYLAIFVSAASLTCFIACIHLFIDKVFFKSLWQKPSVFNALRRSILLSISILIIIYLKFLRVELLTLLLIPASAIVIEIIYISLEKDLIKILSKFTKQTKPLIESNHE